jgi:protein phosphatase 1G
MGQYLSSPNTDQESVAGTHERLGAYGVVSMQGWRKSQEDAHIAEHLSDDCHIFGVFDGHGGPEVARFCSRRMPLELKRHPAFAAGAFEESLKQVFHRMDELMRSREGFTELEVLRRECEGGKEPDGNEEDTYDMLRKLVQLQRMTGGQQGEGKGSMDEPALQPEITIQAGCTAVVALIVHDQLYVANAGDSRAVLCRGGKAVPMSEDHKPAQPDERARIMAAGGFLSEIGGITRVNGNLNLSRAIGDLRYKMNNELEPKDQIITAEPDVLTQRLTRDDSFLVLACDGIWDVMDNQQVVDFVHQRLAKGIAPRDIASELLNSCLANDPREARGIGCDNMTAAIVVFEPSSGPLRHGSCSCGARSDEAEHALANGHHTCGSGSGGASSGSADTSMREATPVPDAAPPAAAAAAKA